MKGQTKHPVFRQLTKEDLDYVGPEKFRFLLEDRETKIKAEKDDPFYYGVSHKTHPDLLPHWVDFDNLIEDPEITRHFLFGGNRSGKTEYMARKVVEVMEDKPGAIIWVCGLSAESSVQVQQAAINRYIPKEYKGRRPGPRGVSNIAFSAKNGFTGNNFILPNGSQCWFKNYTMDASRLEGANLDMAWCDELVPPTWVETLKYRLIDRMGKLVVSFTPIEGYTPVVKEAMAGHIITKWRECDRAVMPDGKMPYMGRTRHGDSLTWFFSEDNPYIPWNHFKKSALAGKTTTEKEIRAFGYVKNPIVGMFPRFGDQNVVSHDQIPTKGTNYMAIDPTGGERNWFMVWVRVDDLGRHWVYREWPDNGTYGDWAEPSTKLDGKPGPAQKADCGKSLTAYRKLIRHLEKGEVEPVERFIDPRAGKSSVLSEKEGSFSLIDKLSEDVLDRDGNLAEAGMVFVPAAATQINEGVQAINSLLSYNSEDHTTVYNEPKLYVSERCGNIIYSLREWTNADGDKGACKDPADSLRYLILMEPTYVAPGVSWSEGGGTY